MKKFLEFFFIRHLFPQKKNAIRQGVNYSVKKYNTTYKLLEEYDKKAVRNPEELADAGRLQDFIRGVQ